MKAMTRKELSLLTQKQIKEYVKLKKPGLKVPKKWADKESALNWVEKNMDVKVEPKKEVKEKPAIKSGPRTKTGHGEAIERRYGIVSLLRSESCTVLELANRFGIKYKSMLDDLHAVRHGRGDHQYLKEGQVLIGVNVGKTRVFKVSTNSAAEKDAADIKETIQIKES